jgi:hypothetical protein
MDSACHVIGYNVKRRWFIMHLMMWPALSNRPYSVGYQEPGSFHLVSQQPRPLRRVFENCPDSLGPSLEAAGLTERQEVLFVEMLG